jgi:ferredoxin
MYSQSSPDESPEARNDDKKIDLIAVDPRFTRVRLSRAMGIDWGTDLSFSYVYVRGMDPAGAAAMSKQVQVGDQLCELTPVVRDNNAPTSIYLLGAPFDYVMESFASMDKTTYEVDLVFFRGSKNELKAVASGTTSDSSSENERITVTVIQNKGAPNESTQTLTAPAGVNLRQLCVDNNINVYQSLTRWTNCKGKQLCGTCIVNVKDGGKNTNRKSMDEESTLRENPDGYRLSCVTFAYGDVTVETLPPVNVAQWTR